MQYCFQHVKGSCPKAQRVVIFKAVIYVIMVGTIVVAVCGNIMVIISISHFKQLHSPTNFLILSLACVDCFLGAFIMPYSMICSVETCWYFGEMFCKIHSSFDMMMSTASILHLGFIAIDRYYAICEPLRYRSKITMSIITIFISITWIVSLGFGFGVIYSKVNLEGIEGFVILNHCVGTCFVILNKMWGLLGPLVSFIIPGTVMIFLYIRIFVVARRHAKVIDKILSKPSNHDIAENRERKAAKTLGIVMGVFLLCWLPFFITIIIDPFINFSTPIILFDTLMWLGYFNSACNPIIYGLFYPWFQKAFKIIITGKVFKKYSSFINLFTENNY
ncbi:trace amine-associated receptor 4-like [Amia ocellicauda]|uniref:trace amine-associated receptor 4-like n=1 Tax=Amia ocellicauda TaxID=2972642 RepID=UPI0034639A74